MVVRLLGMTKIGKFPYYVLRGEGSSAMILSMVLICADDPPPRRVLFVALLQSNYARTFFCQRGVAVASI
jgi:hypothetical protein